MANTVFVLSITKGPLMPCHPARARELLKKKKACVYKAQPFTIILKDREEGDTQPIICKNDPGSKTTGIALVVEGKRGNKICFAANLQHKGLTIKDNLTQRRGVRRLRRFRHTRYRAPRFLNRARPKGWLAPSLQSRVDNVGHWNQKLSLLAPVTSIEVETTRFDTQKMANPKIKGVEYQQGTLAGYEVREYLLEKWQRTCAYCDKQDTALEIEHIVPKIKHGSNRVSNLTLACHACNQKKGSQDISDFVKDKKRLAKILKQAKIPLRDAAALSSIRFEIGTRLKELGMPVSFWTGGRTKFNRCAQGYTKDHWLDAACVGEGGRRVYIPKSHSVLLIQAQGRGSRQMCRVDRFGFPRTAPKKAKRVKGFQTGDLVKAIVPSGKKKGTHVGRVAVRSSGFFNIKAGDRTVQGIGAKHCQMIQRVDGYSYQPFFSQQTRALPLGEGVSDVSRH